MKFTNYIKKRIPSTIGNQIALSIGFAALFGLLLKVGAVSDFIKVINFDLDIFKKIGLIFVSLLKMISAPFIFTALATSIFELSDNKEIKISAIATKTIVIFVIMTVISALIGIGSGVLLKPGHNVKINLHDVMFGVNNANHAKIMALNSAKSISDIIFDTIPNNIFDAFLKSNFIQIIFCALIFAIAVIKMENHRIKRSVILAIYGGNKVILSMVSVIMKIAPVCTFFIITWLIATQDINLIIALFKLIVVMFGDALLIIFPLYGLVSLALKLNPIMLFKKILPVQLLSFFTASSATSLPLGMKIGIEKLGINKSYVNFVMPLGTAINMNGGVMHFSLVTIFIAQLLGVDLVLQDYCLLFFMVILMSIGTAPVPGAAIFLLANLLTIMNLPVEAVSIILAIDRILDMIRTMINVSADVVSSLIVARISDGVDIKVFNSKE